MEFSFDLGQMITLLGVALSAGVLIGRINALEKKVEKHNNLVERLYKVETNLGDIDVGVLNERVHENALAIEEMKKGVSNSCLKKCPSAQQTF